MSTALTDEVLSTPQVVDVTGASYRQIDYLCREGVLPAAWGLRGPGSGNRRVWTLRQAAVVAAVVRLVDAGAAPSDLRAVVAALDALPGPEWAGVWYVTPEAPEPLSRTPQAPSGLFLDLGDRTHVDPEP